MNTYTLDAHDSFVAEYRVMITQDEAATGTRRTLRFYGPDGRERVGEVVVPAGSVTGSRLTINPTHSDVAWGEVRVIITVLPHQRWETRGDDLILHVQIDRPSAVRAGTLTIDIGHGRTIAVPINAAQSHSRYIYAGYGLPRSYNVQRNGDLIVQLDLIDMPETTAPAVEGVERSWWRSLFGL